MTDSFRYNSPTDVGLQTVRAGRKEVPVRVTLKERVGSRVLLREVDPGEPEPPRVRIYEGDELIVMQAVPHLSVHTGLDPKCCTRSV